jgi:hypothetical protein
MREHTTTHRFARVSRTFAMAALAVATSTAANAFAEGDTCPPRFECSSRIASLLADGMEQSGTFRAMVETLGSHPGVSLDLGLRRPKAGKRAQSDLRVSGYYEVSNGERLRRVTGVSGEVSVPMASFSHKQIGLIAHELAHVLIRLRDGAQLPPDVEEREANTIEKRVLAELKRSRAANAGG